MSPLVDQVEALLGRSEGDSLLKLDLTSRTALAVWHERR